MAAENFFTGGTWHSEAAFLVAQEPSIEYLLSRAKSLVLSAKYPFQAWLRILNDWLLSESRTSECQNGPQLVGAPLQASINCNFDSNAKTFSINIKKPSIYTNKFKYMIELTMV